MLLGRQRFVSDINDEDDVGEDISNSKRQDNRGRDNSVASSRENENKLASSRQHIVDYQAAAREREKEREEKIIKKHLFGVAPPEDKSLFEDPSGLATTINRSLYIC